MEYQAGPEPPYVMFKMDRKYDAVAAKKCLNRQGKKVPRKQSPQGDRGNGYSSESGIRRGYA